jgi:hypothetical protein
VSNPPVEIPAYGTPSPSTGLPPQPVPAPPLPGGRTPVGAGIVVLRVLGALVVITLVVVGTGGVIAGFFRQTRTETHEYAGPITAVTVEATTGSITVHPGGAGSPVRVTSRLTWSFGEATSVEEVTDGRLDVEARCGNTLVGLCQVGYDVTVPPGIPLVLGTHTGTIDATGLTGDLTATTHTGSVELRDLRSHRVEATTSTGSVELSFAAPPESVTAETSTGSVDVALPGGLSYDVTAATSTGSTDVSVPTDPSAGRHVRAHTSTGSVDVHPYGPGDHGSD